MVRSRDVNPINGIESEPHIDVATSSTLSRNPINGIESYMFRESDYDLVMDSMNPINGIERGRYWESLGYWSLARESHKWN